MNLKKIPTIKLLLLLWFGIPPLSDQSCRAQSQNSIVYFFLTQECPVARHMVGEIKEIFREFKDERIDFTIVFSGNQHTDSSVRFYLLLHDLISIPFVLDTNLHIAKSYFVQVAPAVCMVSDDKIIYNGRISDLYYRLGRRKSGTINKDFHIFLSLWISGKIESVKAAPPVGCILF